ncbi:hypothetical protein E2C01_049157 [Portunus trituberculatus]|uniref:Uncharacterized protein n=1 Tax=Portunus trituberculatus TaxID=210409 RepID=A0A5B7GCY1_PORTR|nr:hypothetical protein [Portunus trituberculatus]
MFMREGSDKWAAREVVWVVTEDIADSRLGFKRLFSDSPQKS